MCERLVHDPAMRAVWKALYRRRPKWQQGPKGHDGKLVREIVREMLEAPIRSTRTAAKRRGALHKIANKARELKELVTVAAADGLWEWVLFEEGGEQSYFFDALDQLAKQVTELADQPERRIKRTPNATALEMAVRLSEFIESTLNEPLHEHVVTITNVVCDSALTRDNVKSALRSRRASQARKLNK